MSTDLSLDSPKKDLIQELLTEYIHRNTTSNQCQVCGAYQRDHTHDDCPVKLASDMLGELG